MHPLRHTRILYKILDGKKLRAFIFSRSISHIYIYIYILHQYSRVSLTTNTYIHIFVTEYNITLPAVSLFHSWLSSTLQMFRKQIR